MSDAYKAVKRAMNDSYARKDLSPERPQTVVDSGVVSRLLLNHDAMLNALIAVERWWMDEGREAFNGAPYAIFAARQAIELARKSNGK